MFSFARHLGLLLALGVMMGCASPAERPIRYRIAVIPKGTTHDFWKSIHAGALEAIQGRNDVDIIWEGPAKEDQRQEQQQIVERFTSESVSAMVLAPCDRQTLVPAVERALRQGIPVAIIDSGLELSEAAQADQRYLGYIATDNRQGGVKAAERMVEILKGKPDAKVLMIRYQKGSESTEQREAGFRDTIRATPAIHFIEAADEAGATVDSAQKAAERVLSDHQNLDGIFAPNESSSVGVLRALEVLGRVGKIKLVGFDASEILINALATSKLHGLVVQDPFDMGYQSVRRSIEFLENKPLPKDRTRHTNLQLLTKENMDDPANKLLYARDLKPYLDE
jgi:ribose transport system substrate-binding protein